MNICGPITLMLPSVGCILFCYAPPLPIVILRESTIILIYAYFLKIQKFNLK